MPKLFHDFQRTGIRHRGVATVLRAALALVMVHTTTAASQQPLFDLDEALRREPRLIVCIWSPHMPLSVDAVHEATLAAATLKVTMVALLDPNSDEGYARSIAASAQLPAGALNIALSRHPLPEEAFHHAPTVIAFANGKQTGTVIRGYMTAPAYVTALARRFESRP